MAQTLIKATGTDGVLELRTDRVVIERKGLWAKFSHGGGIREIPISSITTVEFKNANLFAGGEIDFVLSGRRQTDKPNQNKVKFNKKEQKNFHELKEKLFEMISHLGQKAS